MSSDSATRIQGTSQCIEVGIGFGSNLGDRLANLSKAKRYLLEICDIPDKALFSPVYETEPVDCPPQTSSFYNAVGQITLTLDPECILEHCLRIERLLGRENHHEKNSPRTIDLDILYAGDIISGESRLTIPHPKLRMRLFVLTPLATIRPGLCLPGDNITVNDHFNELSTNRPELPMVTQYW
jgi:2-amino-4-hydroxy-6-hydroxymethyldihydropteridine diphosphokinase